MSTTPTIARVARVVAAKDLRIEMRSHIVVQQVLPFSGLVMVMFAFALDNDDVLQRVAGGLVWLATLFSLFIVVQRSYAIETSDGALDALLGAAQPHSDRACQVPSAGETRRRDRP
jgi:heme exporter protein B